MGVDAEFDNDGYSNRSNPNDMPLGSIMVQRPEDLTARRSLLIISNRALERQCLAYSISTHNKNINVFCLSSIEDWKNRQVEFPLPDAILLDIGAHHISDIGMADDIACLCSETNLPVILLADTDELNEVFEALECGVKGYIPSSVTLDICVEAISLSMAGGVFVPITSLMAMRGAIAKPTPNKLSDMFTDRQLEVVEALRRGKANKIIAYELKMQESTVKVHIRNIMKKVKATNRTEVAYKIMELLPH